MLDVGCWTGGVSLILERLGAKVTAIDEVGQYPNALNFMAEAFGLLIAYSASQVALRVGRGFVSPAIRYHLLPGRNLSCF